MVNAFNAVYNTQLNCANQGLNIANDIAGTQHVGGPAHQDAATGQFYVLDNVGNEPRSTTLVHAAGTQLSRDERSAVQRPDTTAAPHGYTGDKTVRAVGDVAPVRRPR